MVKAQENNLLGPCIFHSNVRDDHQGPILFIDDNVEINCWYDGACEPFNPGGNGSYGAIIKINNYAIFKESAFIGRGISISSNVAEYAGALAILKKLISLGLNRKFITIHGDNRMSILQMSGQWKSKKGLYRQNYLEAIDLIKSFPSIKFKWIPREDNIEADALSKSYPYSMTDFNYFSAWDAAQTHSKESESKSYGDKNSSHLECLRQ